MAFFKSFPKTIAYVDPPFVNCTHVYIDTRDILKLYVENQSERQFGIGIP